MREILNSSIVIILYKPLILYINNKDLYMKNNNYKISSFSVFFSSYKSKCLKCDCYMALVNILCRLRNKKRERENRPCLFLLVS